MVRLTRHMAGIVSILASKHGFHARPLDFVPNALIHCVVNGLVTVSPEGCYLTIKGYSVTEQAERVIAADDAKFNARFNDCCDSL